MRRLAIAVALAAGPAAAQDRIMISDQRGEREIPGRVTAETVNGLELRTQQGAALTVAPDDVARATFEDLPMAARLSYSSALAAESGGDYGRALEGFQAAAAAAPANSWSRRHAEYKAAAVKAASARDAAGRKDAEAALEAFLAANPKSWQATLAVRRLARLRADAGDYAGAAKALERVTSDPALSGDLKRRLRLQLIDAFLLAGETAAAARLVTEAKAEAGSAGPLLEVYEIATRGGPAEPRADQLRKIIAAENDAGLKAVAYNAMGDCYTQEEKHRDAMWSYLWVDVVYPQDPAQHRKAVERLARVFEKLGDTDRAGRYRAKLEQMQ